jgi:small-conductance mechanosensitive channel
VVSMTLTYVAIATDDGLLKVPNSGVLAAAVGPWGHMQSSVSDEASRVVSSHRETARSS